MKEVMTNQLALKFNWCGTKGKAAFKDLRLSNVLFSKYFVRVILMECRKWALHAQKLPWSSRRWHMQALPKPLPLFPPL